MNSANSPLRLKVRVATFGSKPLAEILGLSALPDFTSHGDPLYQLKTVEAHTKSLGCKSIVVESPYIDRDFIEDYSAFYARSLASVGNSCTRVHFFTTTPATLRRRINRLHSSARSIADPSSVFSVEGVPSWQDCTSADAWR
jgi:hypothetical protein